MLVCFDDIFTGVMNVSIGGEDLITDYVKLFSLLMDNRACFVHYVMDVHYTFCYGFYLVIFLLHKTSLHFELDLQILLLIKRILMSFVTMMSNFIPWISWIPICFLILHTFRSWKFFFLHFYLFRFDSLMIISRI